MGGTVKKFIPRSLPLQGWVTGKKSFNESLRTDGNQIEQGINKWVLNAVGQGERKGGGYYKQQDYSALQKMAQGNPSNQMMNDVLMQKQMTDQALASQKAANLQSANVQQQQNVNMAMQNSKENLNNSLMRTPVPSTFSKITPASTNQFKLPNVAGLTFRK
jgi:hypothetical protein